jgi:AcrR family transcriptional regulator
MSRTTVSRDESRTQVLTRAASAIAEHGYHGMSMRDLAKATGRGLASFYHLFGSKEDILFELHQRAFQHLLSSAEATLAEPGTAVVRLHRFIANHVHYFVEQPDVMRVLVQEAAALPPKRRAIIRTLKQRYFTIGEELLRAVISDMGGPPPTALEVERRAYCMFGMLNWIFGWYDAQRHGSPRDLARTIVEMTVSGAAGSTPVPDAGAPLRLGSLLQDGDSP